MLPAGWRRRFEGRAAEERRLAPLTTWRIGGPAQLYLEPGDVEELHDTVALLRRSGIPYRILGGGSNLLVADRGVRGAVVSLARLCAVRKAGGVLEAEAGARLLAVVRLAADEGWKGFENLAGIPGRVGGAVFGNAGSRFGAIGDLVVALDLMRPDGALERLVPPPGFFRYRASDVGDRIVVRAFLAGAAADPRLLRARVRELVRERRRSQPGWVGNAGCVFKNPKGDAAGRLIDTAGCKGLRAGGVHVSAVHANFFENDGTGTEGDVLRLVDLVRDRVRRVHGKELELEVRRWE
jgi:UDP-N-acetylmuramate dehydrogenase